jgi:hypothetical protein
MAALTLVARSQRCHGVSAALAEKLRTSNSPTGRIQASPRDPGDTYDLEMVASLRSRISAHVFELNDNALGSRRYPPFAQSSAPQYSKNYRLTQMGPSRIALLCECGKRTSGDRPVADRKALASTRCRFLRNQTKPGCERAPPRTASGNEIRVAIWVLQIRRLPVCTFPSPSAASSASCCA